jgi:hypothetical protein
MSSKLQDVPTATLAATVSRGLDAEWTAGEDQQQAIKDAKEALSELVERCKWLSELTGRYTS